MFCWRRWYSEIHEKKERNKNSSKKRLKIQTNISFIVMHIIIKWKRCVKLFRIWWNFVDNRKGKRQPITQTEQLLWVNIKINGVVMLPRVVFWNSNWTSEMRISKWNRFPRVVKSGDFLTNDAFSRSKHTLLL